MLTLIIQSIVIFIVAFIVVFLALAFIVDALGFKKGVGVVMATSLALSGLLTYSYLVIYLPWSCSNYRAAYEAADSKYDYMTNRCLIQDPSNGKFVTPNNYGRAN